MIMFRDYIDQEELHKCDIPRLAIINVESLQFLDAPRYYYRVWYWKCNESLRKEFDMFSMESAPKTGKRIQIIKKSGDRYIGRWAIKENAIFSAWLTDDNKYLDASCNPIIGWVPLNP